jgi:mannose-P-dolichol utilization defect protein 1
LAVASVATIAAVAALYKLPDDALSILQFSTLPLSLFSKLPQIRQNSRYQSTGQLSAFAVVSQIAGCLARLFTTATELSDVILTAGFALALLLTCVLGAQMWMYWGNDAKDEHEKYPEATTVEDEKPQWMAPPSEPVGRLHSPVPQLHGSQASGRKWARKVA